MQLNASKPDLKDCRFCGGWVRGGVGATGGAPTDRVCIRTGVQQHEEAHDEGKGMQHAADVGCGAMYVTMPRRFKPAGNYSWLGVNQTLADRVARVYREEASW